MVNSVEMRERVIAKLRREPLGHPIEVSWEKWKPKRSSYQERRYRALVDDMAEASGYDPVELHELMLKRFAPRKSVTVMDEELEIVKRTSEMDSEEHEIFYRSVRQLAQEYGVA